MALLPELEQVVPIYSLLVAVWPTAKHLPDTIFAKFDIVETSSTENKFRFSFKISVNIQVKYSTSVANKVNFPLIEQMFSNHDFVVHQILYSI